MFYLNKYKGNVTHAALLDRDNAILVSGPTNFYRENDGFMYVLIFLSLLREWWHSGN